MNKVVVSIVGQDSPAVVYVISSALSELSCNIEDVSQTILKNQFAAIFIVTLPDALTSVSLERELTARVIARNLQVSVVIRPFDSGCPHNVRQTEPFVVTVDGNDRFEILASLTRIFADQGVNIENLKALRPEDDPNICLIMFEISLPVDIDRAAFTQTLQSRAGELGLRVSMQHQDIFEAVHRISTL